MVLQVEIPRRYGERKDTRLYLNPEWDLIYVKRIGGKRGLEARIFGGICA